MTRYVRLGYLVPRLVLLVALLCVAEWGVGWGLRAAIVNGGQNAVGAKVEVRSAAVSVLGARATLRDLAIADPNRPMQNLLEAELVELDFDANSLLRRRAIADRGVVRGLRFGTSRETSGELSDEQRSEATGGDGRLGRLAEQLASDAADRWVASLNGDLRAEVAGLESVRLAKQLQRDWPRRVRGTRDEAEALEADVQRVGRLAKEASENPLRHADFLARAPQEFAELKRRADALRGEVATWPTELATDRDRVDAARIADEHRLRERLQVDQLDPDSLTSYLLGDQLTGPVRELVGWVRWAREMVPAKPTPSRVTERARGVDVRFAGVRQRPELLVRSLRLSGVAELGGGPIELDGLVTDFTTSPELHAAPMQITLAGSGATPISLRGTINRTAAQALDEFVLDCPTVALPEAVLGDPGGLAFAMAPSTASVTLSLRVEGERIAGELQLVQDRLSLSSRVADSAGETTRRIAAAVGDSVDTLPRAATRVSLGGTLDDPRVAVWSSLGPAISEALVGSAQRIAEGEAERRVADFRNRVAAELAPLETLLADATSELTEGLAGPIAQIEGFAGGWPGGGLQTGTFGFEKLGKRLPDAKSLFR
ncbi:MAG: TIGR03545 family protein [Planctomycetota bacterium]